jgi:hypothetical protein
MPQQSHWSLIINKGLPFSWKQQWLHTKARPAIESNQSLNFEGPWARKQWNCGEKLFMQWRGSYLRVFSQQLWNVRLTSASVNVWCWTFLCNSDKQQDRLDISRTSNCSYFLFFFLNEESHPTHICTKEDLEEFQRTKIPLSRTTPTSRVNPLNCFLINRLVTAASNF